MKQWCCWPPGGALRFGELAGGSARGVGGRPGQAESRVSQTVTELAYWCPSRLEDGRLLLLEGLWWDCRI